MLPNTCAHSRNANAPAPANVICASEICLDHPVSGTSDNMISAVTIESVSRRTFGRSSRPCAISTTTNSTSIP